MKKSMQNLVNGDIIRRITRSPRGQLKKNELCVFTKYQNNNTHGLYIKGHPSYSYDSCMFEFVESANQHQQKVNQMKNLVNGDKVRRLAVNKVNRNTVYTFMGYTKSGTMILWNTRGTHNIRDFELVSRAETPVEKPVVVKVIEVYDSSNPNKVKFCDMPKAHVKLLINAWIDGEQLQYFDGGRWVNRTNGTIKTIGLPAMYNNTVYRVLDKKAVAARKQLEDQLRELQIKSEEVKAKLKSI